MGLVQIPGTKLYRDTDSMALVNKDNSGLEEYLTKRKLAQGQRDEINKVKSEMQGIKDDVAEIKRLVLKLLEGSNV